MLARLMESQKWHPIFWLCGSVGGRLRKGTMASAAFLSERKLSPRSRLDAIHFSFALYATDAFQAATPVLELRGSEPKSMYGSFKRKCLGLQKFLPLTQSPLLFAARSYGELSFWTWNPGLGGLVVVLGLLVPEISLLNFYPPHVDVGPDHSMSPPLLSVQMNVIYLIP